MAELQTGQVAESVTVTAGESLVQTTNAEITNTVTPKQVKDLPLDGRDPLQLIQLQAGVTQNNGRADVTIDGQRTSSATVTQDGITIQDYAIRTNALSFSPNRTTVAQVSEFSVTTQNGGADQQGASQVRLITPSGMNELHGEVFEYHRNDALGANDFFNNANGIERPQLIRNQFGFAVGGPAYVPKLYNGRDKFFFFGAYVGFRERTAVPETLTVFTPAARRHLPVPRRDDRADPLDQRPEPVEHVHRPGHWQPARPGAAAELRPRRRPARDLGLLVQSGVADEPQPGDGAPRLHHQPPPQARSGLPVHGRVQRAPRHRHELQRHPTRVERDPDALWRPRVELDGHRPADE